MSLTSSIKKDIKKAIKNGDSDRVSVLRMLSSALHNRKIKEGRELKEEEEIEVISKEAKQRRESIEAFADANREEMAEKERWELSIVEKYLPEQLDRQQIEELVQQAVHEVGADSKSDVGRVMGAVMPKVKGKADGSKVKEIVRDVLVE